MVIFNEHRSTSSYTIGGGGSGPRGVPGVGFVLTPNGNYNIENKTIR